jgi:cellulose synthase (UDP-forming)
MSATYWITLISLGIILVLFARYRDRERLRWVAVGIGLFLTVRYLYWRVAYTLNTSDRVGLSISLIIFLAEIYGLFATLLFYFQVATPTARSSEIDDCPDLPTVDIFLTSYDEKVELVRRSLMACRAIDYPPEKKKIYLLDDGSRDEMKQLATDLNCIYITRSSREHAKAGNLNNALKFSSGEFIVNFDADHIPAKTFLKKTIGFFTDPKVAIVQTPHYFYNPDIYQRNLKAGHKISHEQDLFFQVLQPGRDFTNSSFYCGSGAVIRREPLNKINGFATQSVTEDIHTTMLIHALGYRTVYVRDILAVGLSPESFKSYLGQRQRWTRGHLQIFLSRDNPFLSKGLTVAQRINYFASIYYFLFGPARIIYLAVPLAFLLLGVPPLMAPLADIVNFYGSHYLGSLIPFAMVSGRHRNPFWSDVYETVMCFSLTATIVETLFRPGKLLFNVTPKGQKFAKSELDMGNTIPHLCLMVLLGVGVIWGGYSWIFNTANRDALLISLVLASYNLILLASAIFAAREEIQRRGSFRLERQISCELVFNGQRMALKTTDISEAGIGFSLDRPVFLPQHLIVNLEHAGETLSVPGTVVHNDVTSGAMNLVGIKFDPLALQKEQRLMNMLYAISEDWKVNEKVAVGFGDSFTQLLTSPFKSTVRLQHFRRTQPRIKAFLSCELQNNGKTFNVSTRDISGRGVKIVVPKGDWPTRGILSVKVSHRGQVILSGQGQLVWKRGLFNKQVVGVRWLEDHPILYETWYSLSNAA